MGGSIMIDLRNRFLKYAGLMASTQNSDQGWIFNISVGESSGSTALTYVQVKEM
jgi:hypothetical protein